jgi:hypothetical protein
VVAGSDGSTIVVADVVADVVFVFAAVWLANLALSRSPC